MLTTSRHVRTPQKPADERVGNHIRGARLEAPRVHPAKGSRRPATLRRGLPVLPGQRRHDPSDLPADSRRLHRWMAGPWIRQPLSDTEPRATAARTRPGTSVRGVAGDGRPRGSRREPSAQQRPRRQKQPGARGPAPRLPGEVRGADGVARDSVRARVQESRAGRRRVKGPSPLPVSCFLGRAGHRPQRNADSGRTMVLVRYLRSSEERR